MRERFGWAVFNRELTDPNLETIISLLNVRKLIKERLWNIHYIIY